MRENRESPDDQPSGLEPEGHAATQDHVASGGCLPRGCRRIADQERDDARRPRHVSTRDVDRREAGQACDDGRNGGGPPKGWTDHPGEKGGSAHHEQGGADQSLAASRDQPQRAARTDHDQSDGATNLQELLRSCLHRRAGEGYVRFPRVVERSLESWSSRKVQRVRPAGSATAPSHPSAAPARRRRRPQPAEAPARGARAWTKARRGAACAGARRARARSPGRAGAASSRGSSPASGR